MKIAIRHAQLVGCSILSLLALAFLLGRFANFMPLRGDLISHFLLVDEIMKYGHVRPDALNIGFMRVYPSGSHWLAAVVGWFQGSGLYGISAVSIAAVFACYMLILRLVDPSRPLNLIVFLALFIAIGTQHSLVGWEISNGNFFYPQIVADVLYFWLLVWLDREMGVWQQTTWTVVAGTLAMSVQPLIGLHILAAGAMLTAYQGIRSNWKLHAVPVAAIVTATVLLALFHPSFLAMRQNAEHEGQLTFGYTHLFAVAGACAAISFVNLIRGQRTDAILGSAGGAAVCLMLMQYLALSIAHTGSDYAVKKHMFLIVTLATINAARMIGSWISSRRLPIAWIVSPLVAGLVTGHLAGKFDTPITPIDNVLTQARNMAGKPGDTVMADQSLPPLINLVTTLSELQHPFYWFGGSDLFGEAKYAMVRKADIGACEIFAETADYAKIATACLRRYQAGETLAFKAGATGYYFLGRGWSVPDDFGIWTEGAGGSVVSLSLPDGFRPHELSATYAAFVTPAHPKQSFDVVINGAKVATWNFDTSSTVMTRTAPIPADVRDLTIVFVPTDPAAPSALDPSIGDTRMLGMRLKSISFQ